MGGFTLLEVVVVLVITSLVVGILMEGLYWVVRLQERFEPEIYFNQRAAMYRDWFRISINGLMPDHPDGFHRFHGESRRLKGLTLASLDQPSGQLRPIMWSLRFNSASGQTELLLGDDKDGYAILGWPGHVGRFRYLDAAGDWHDEWPPFLGQWPQLPVLIAVEGGEEGGELIASSPRGPMKPKPRLKDLADG